MPTTIIEDQLAAWLAALDGVQAQAAGRVYPFGAVKQGTDWPFLTYFRVAGQRCRHLKGVSGVSAPLVQVGAHGLTYASAKRLADVASVALGAFGRGRFVPDGNLVQAVIVRDGRDGRDGDTPPPHGSETTQFQVTIDAEIWFQE